MKKNILEYDVMRVLLTLIVVVGHCAYVVIESDYGGIDYSELVKDSSIQFLINANNYMIYTFHMPCFIALSGAIYSMQNRQEKRMGLGSFFLNKYKRLVIPFFVVGLIYSVPLKYLTGYWAHSEHPVKDICIGQFFVQGNTHLWYLACLFLIFIVFWWYNQLEQIKFLSAGMSICIVLFFVLHVSTPSHLINNVLNNLLWFWCGYQFEKHREKLNFQINLKICLALIVLFLLLAGFDILFWKDFSDNSLIRCSLHNIYRITVALTGSCALYTVSYQLSKGKLPDKMLFQRFNRASFGVYLYSDPLNYVILFLIGHTLNGINSNVVATILFFLRLLLTLTIAFYLTEFIRRKNIKYIA